MPYEHALVEAVQHRLSLLLAEDDPDLMLRGVDQRIRIRPERPHLLLRQRCQFGRHIPLSCMECRRVDDFPPLQGVHLQVSFEHHGDQPVVDGLPRDLQHLRRPADEFLSWQEGVPLSHGIGKQDVDPAADTSVVIRRQTDLFGDLVRPLESDAFDIIDQLERIFGDRIRRIRPVHLIETYRIANTDAHLLQFDGHIGKFLMLFVDPADLQRLLQTDAADFRQTGRRFLQDAERIHSELRRDGSRLLRPDAFDQTRREECDDAVRILRCRLFVFLKPELFAKLGVVTVAKLTEQSVEIFSSSTRGVTN